MDHFKNDKIDIKFINDIITNIPKDSPNGKIRYDIDDNYVNMEKRASEFELRFVPTFTGDVPRALLEQKHTKYLVTSIIWQIDCSKSNRCGCGYGGTSLLITKVSNDKDEYFAFIDLWQHCLTYDNVLIIDIANNFDDLFNYALIDKYRLVYSYDLISKSRYDISLYKYYNKDIQVLIDKVKTKLTNLPTDLLNLILKYCLANVKIEKPKMLYNQGDDSD